MKVSQLIEALRHMPPDAEIEAYSCHHISGGRHRDTMRVGLLKDRVLIGNWSTYGLRELIGTETPPASVGTIYAVRRYGQAEGDMVTERVVETDKKDPVYISPERDQLELMTAADIEEAAETAERVRRNEEARERAEYERLRAKYEKPDRPR